MRRSRHEFSKVIVRWTLQGFFLQVLVASVFSFFKGEIAYQLVSLLNATVPVYIVILGGYFGKAGIENYNKIKYDAASNDEVG